MNTTTTEELRELRARARLTTREMSELALLADPASWSRAERRGVLDSARLVLVRARVECLQGNPDGALRILMGGNP